MSPLESVWGQATKQHIHSLVNFNSMIIQQAITEVIKDNCLVDLGYLYSPPLKIPLKYKEYVYIKYSILVIVYAVQVS